MDGADDPFATEVDPAAEFLAKEQVLSIIHKKSQGFFFKDNNISNKLFLVV